MVYCGLCQKAFEQVADWDDHQQTHQLYVTAIVELISLRLEAGRKSRNAELL